MTLFVVLSMHFSGFGQQPSHFIIGSDVFRNSHVYSLLIHSQNLLYATTNYGMFVYKNGHFQAIEPAKEQHGSSLFSLVENKKGEVFCCNLAGQIFKLEDDRLKLYSNVPEEYLAAAIEIDFNAQDDLIVRSKVFLCADSEGWRLIHKPELGSTLYMNAFDKNRILISKYNHSEMLCLHGNTTEILSLDSSFSNAKDGYYQFPAYLNNSLVSLYRSGLFINHSARTLKRFEPLDIRAFHQVGDNEILGLNKTNGARRIYLEKEELLINNTILSDYFISVSAKSKNGTIYFGTFNQGIIVIPNMASNVLSKADNFFTGICTTPDGLIAIDRSGSIFNVTKSKIELFKKECALFRGRVLYVSGVDFDLVTEKKALIFDANNSNLSGDFGLVKAATRVDSTTAIVATSKGVFRRGLGADQFDWIPTEFSSGWTRISTNPFRCKAVAYDVQNGDLYYATQKGLVYLNENGETKTYLDQNAPIHCNDLVYEQGNVWIATQTKGILKIRNGTIVQRIHKKNGLASNYVRKIQLHEDNLYVSHKSGFQIVDLKTNNWKSIGAAEGINNGSIDDFSVFEGNLWIVSNGQIIILELNQSEKKPEFSLVVSSVQLGDSLLAANNKSRLPYDQNHFVARFNFRGIEYESEAFIQYRLKGLNDDWKNLGSTSGELEYNALAPGDYQFEIRIKYRTLESEAQVYPFSIQVPFWQAWWFYFLLILATASIVIVITRIRLKRTRKEQLRQMDQQKMQTNILDSELKALRSQMNPHFIFNSLNSIQDLVLREDKERAYDYIVLFAKLVRNTLNYSNEAFIPIEKELEFLHVYLSLEKLRFGDSFEYTIQYNGSKDIDVPSMLLQPFIENALVHGLIHKKGLKKLDISFHRSNGLSCTITDNGIGRKKATEIQQRQRGNHASFALTAIEQRLMLLNLQFGEEIGKYVVTDLFEEDQPVGTRVEINIPFRISNHSVK